MSIERIKAMVAQARKPGRCSLQAQAAIDQLYGQLFEEKSQIELRLKQLTILRKKAETPPARLINPLDPPSKDHEAVAVFDGDGFQVYWEFDYDLIEFGEWPFDQDYVFTEDIEKLGFRVEIA